MNTSEYPKIAANIEASVLMRLIEFQNTMLVQQTTKLNEVVLEIQKTCPHTAGFIEGRGKLNWSLNQNILLSRTCKDCGYVETRDWQKLKPDVVCENCWGKMEYSRTSNDGDRRRFYHCTTCRHEYSET